MTSSSEDSVSRLTGCAVGGQQEQVASISPRRRRSVRKEGEKLAAHRNRLSCGVVVDSGQSVLGYAEEGWGAPLLAGT